MRVGTAIKEWGSLTYDHDMVLCSDGFQGRSHGTSGPAERESVLKMFTDVKTRFAFFAQSSATRKKHAQLRGFQLSEVELHRDMRNLGKRTWRTLVPQVGVRTIKEGVCPFAVRSRN